jgi:hypothetical protein
MFGAKLNRQPGPLNEDALQMLRDKGLKKFTSVVSSDDQLLGTTTHLLLRQDEMTSFRTMILKKDKFCFLCLFL